VVNEAGCPNYRPSKAFRDELEGGVAHVAGWYGIASDPDGLSRIGNALRRLSNEGIFYVGEQLMPKDLPGSGSPHSRHGA